MKRNLLLLATVWMGVFSNSPLLEAEEYKYLDVESTHMYYDGILYMTQNAYVSGYEDGNFYPMNTINRAEALKMILNAAQIPLEENLPDLNFTDLETEAWYLPYLKTAFQKGLISGYPDNTFHPNDPVNRAETLKMFLLATQTLIVDEISDEPWYSPYLKFAQENALLVPAPNLDYGASNWMNRGEMADLIYRFAQSPFTGEIEYGKATFYGYNFDGSGTASGQTLDTEGFMAAHKTLTFGTRIRVTNLDTHLSVDVEVVDRGPYVDGYIVDLTPYAFDQIGSLSTGILNVRIEVLK